MFFTFTKIFWFFAQPSSLIAGLLLIGLGLAGTARFGRTGLRLARIGLALLLIAGLGPVANFVILPLEQRFPARHGQIPDGPIAGIIVLGGYEDGRITRARGTLTLNEAAERLTETARLAHGLTGVRIVVSGGSGTVFLEDAPATHDIGRYLQAIGIAGERIVLEDRSTTTHENARFTHELVKPKPGERFLLVTSAAHMPRAVGAFRAQGFEVLAWPVDFRTKDTGDAMRPFIGVPSGLKRLDEACQEWLGLHCLPAAWTQQRAVPGALSPVISFSRLSPPRRRATEWRCCPASTRRRDQTCDRPCRPVACSALRDGPGRPDSPCRDRRRRWCRP